MEMIPEVIDDMAAEVTWVPILVSGEFSLLYSLLTEALIDKIFGGLSIRLSARHDLRLHLLTATALPARSSSTTACRSLDPSLTRQRSVVRSQHHPLLNLLQIAVKTKTLGLGVKTPCSNGAATGDPRSYTRCY
jgi:hypothetical protein